MLRYANTNTFASWMVCPYSLTDSCSLPDSVFWFKSSSGGISLFQKHILNHMASNVNQVSFPRSLPSSTKKCLAQAAAFEVPLDLRLHSILDNKEEVKASVKTSFRAGQAIPISHHVHPKFMMPSGRIVSDAVNEIAQD